MDPRSPYFKAPSLLFGLSFAAPAVAEEPRREPTLTWHAESHADATRDAAHENHASTDGGAAGALDDGQLRPFTMGAPVARSEVVVHTLAGYDSATASARARSAAEARMTDFLALRAEYEHGPGTSSDDNLTIGARVQFLREATHGIDAGAGFFYQPKDFRGEGDFVGALLVGRRFGRLGLYGNAMFGADSEGDDESAELRLGTGYRLAPSVHVGFDARGRANLSTDSKRFGSQLVDWEVQAGPVASFSFGPVTLVAIAGPSLLRRSEPGSADGRLTTGVQALAGVGGAF